MNKAKSKYQFNKTAWLNSIEATRKAHSKTLRTLIADIVLSALSIAWLAEHFKNMDHASQTIFASFFIGLVLYFKHKA